MRGFLAALLAGLFVGVGVHVGSLALIPRLVTDGLAARVAAVGPEHQFVLVPADGAAAVLNADVSTRLAICRFDLGAGALRVEVPAAGSFQSIGLHADNGVGFWSLDEGANDAASVVITVYTRSQLAETRAREGPDTPDNLRIEAPTPRGFVTIRALVAEPSLAATIERGLVAARCQPRRSE